VNQLAVWLDPEDLWWWAELQEMESTPPSLMEEIGGIDDRLAGGAGVNGWERITSWIGHLFARGQRS
jgi:hypothetical protein